MCASGGLSARRCGVRTAFLLFVLALAALLWTNGDLTPAALGHGGPLFTGDVNCDGRIDSLDALAVLQFEAGLLDKLIFPDGGDSNEDGKINSIDALLILRFDAGLMPDKRPNSCIRVGL